MKGQSVILLTLLIAMVILIGSLISIFPFETVQRQILWIVLFGFVGAFLILTLRKAL